MEQPTHSKRLNARTKHRSLSPRRGSRGVLQPTSPNVPGAYRGYPYPTIVQGSPYVHKPVYQQHYPMATSHQYYPPTSTYPDVLLEGNQPNFFLCVLVFVDSLHIGILYRRSIHSLSRYYLMFAFKCGLINLLIF